MLDAMTNFIQSNSAALWAVAGVVIVLAILIALYKKPSEMRENLKFLFESGNWIIFLAVISFGFIFYALFQQESMLSNLREPSHARGVITFLIVIATITLAFMLVYQAFSVGDEASAEAGFKRAREVFTGLMGVVGTIVGFYFAAGDGLGVGKFEVSSKLDSNRVLLHATGGTPPYRFSATLIPPSETKTLKDTYSQDGWQEVAIESNTTSVSVDVSDSKDRKAPTKRIDTDKK